MVDQFAADAQVKSQNSALEPTTTNSRWSSPKQADSPFLILSSTAVILVLIGLWIFVSIKAFLVSPPSHFEAGLVCVYLILAIVLGVAVWPFKGRLLLLGMSVLLGAALVFAVLTAGAGPALVLVCWLCMVAGGLGLRILHLLAPDASMSEPERTGFAIAIGLGAIAVFVFAIGAMGLLYRSVLFISLASATIILLPKTRPEWMNFLRYVPRMRDALNATRDLRLIAVITSLCVLSFCNALMWAVAPETSFDALNYQLGIPQIYVANHALIDIPYSVWSYLLGSSGMLYATALAVTGQPLPELIHLASGILLATLTFLFGCRQANVTVGLLAAALLYTLPLVTTLSGFAGVDLFVAVFAFGLMYAAVVFVQTSEEGWLSIAGLMAGFALAAKLNTLAVLIPVALLTISRIVTYSRPIKKRIGLFLRLVLPALVIPAPWLIVKTIWTGSPTFPFLNNLFRSPHWPAVNETFNFLTYGRGSGFSALVLLPWNLVVHTDSFIEGPGGVLGSLPLLALPGFLLLVDRRSRRWLGPVALILIGGALIWFKTAQQLRFFLMYVPILAIASASALETVYGKVSRWMIAQRRAQIMALTIGLGMFVASSLVAIKAGVNLPERLPYKFFFGLETRDQFLLRSVPLYRAFAFLNQNAPNSKVLSIGNELRLYTSARIEGVFGSQETNYALGITNSSQLRAFLSARSYDYVLLNQSAAQTYNGFGTLPMLDNNFLSASIELVSVHNNIYLYRAMPANKSQSDSPNLIANCSFEHCSTEGIPFSWFIYGSPLVDHTGKQSRTGLVAVRADATSGLYTRVQTEPGQIYSLGHWCRADEPGALGRLQINWLSSDFSILDSSIALVEAESQWTWHTLTSVAPDGAAYAQIYASAHGNGEIWFDDYGFILGQSPPLKTFCVETSQAQKPVKSNAR